MAVTKEQAIEILKADDICMYSVSDILEARDMAIKALEQEPTTKNDLGVDAVSRQAVLDLMIQKWGENFSGDSAMQESIDAIRVLPSVTPQPTKNNLGVDCISRADAIRVASGYCHPSNVAKELANLPSVTPQEPRKDEVILTKEEYGELVSSEFDNGYAKGYREALEQEPILDKIRAEIDEVYEELDGCDPYSLGTFACRIDDILDKYKAESEET